MTLLNQTSIKYLDMQQILNSMDFRQTSIKNETLTFDKDILLHIVHPSLTFVSEQIGPSPGELAAAAFKII